jgi:UDP-glucuronate 4-epimerase
MKVMITGSAGFIGFHLALKLLKKGFEVRGIDSLNDYYDVSLKKNRLAVLKNFSNFSFINIDITSEKLDKTSKLDGFDVCVHLAAQAGVRYSIENPNAYTQSNLVGFANILELVRNHKLRLIFASTSSVYGANENFPFSENKIADHPIQYYAATKRANELMAHSYSFMYDLETIGLRFFTVYGPYGRPDMALFKFTKNILEDKPIEVYNNGDHLRDFTYVDDIVNGILLSIEFKFPETSLWNPISPSPQFSSARFKIFNLGNNQPIKLMEYINLIEECLNKKANINFLPLQAGDVVQTQADISISSKELGYYPKVDVKDGIKKFIDWYLDYYKKNNG